MYISLNHYSEFETKKLLIVSLKFYIPITIILFETKKDDEPTSYHNYLVHGLKERMVILLKIELYLFFS